MELSTDMNNCLQIVMAIVLITFAMAVAPLGIGFKPFFWDLFEMTNNPPRDENGEIIRVYKPGQKVSNR
jgi:hypothetical protein